MPTQILSIVSLRVYHIYVSIAYCCTVVLHHCVTGTQIAALQVAQDVAGVALMIDTLAALPPGAAGSLSNGSFGAFSGFDSASSSQLAARQMQKVIDASSDLIVSLLHMRMYESVGFVLPRLEVNGVSITGAAALQPLAETEAAGQLAPAGAGQELLWAAPPAAAATEGYEQPSYLTPEPPRPSPAKERRLGRLGRPARRSTSASTPGFTPTRVEPIAEGRESGELAVEDICAAPPVGLSETAADLAPFGKEEAPLALAALLRAPSTSPPPFARKFSTGDDSFDMLQPSAGTALRAVQSAAQPAAQPSEQLRPQKANSLGEGAPASPAEHAAPPSSGAAAALALCRRYKLPVIAAHFLIIALGTMCGHMHTYAPYWRASAAFAAAVGAVVTYHMWDQPCYVQRLAAGDLRRATERLAVAALPALSLVGCAPLLVMLAEAGPSVYVPCSLLVLSVVATFLQVRGVVNVPKLFLMPCCSSFILVPVPSVGRSLSLAAVMRHSLLDAMAAIPVRAGPC